MGWLSDNRQQRYDAAKQGANKQNEIRDAVHKVGESNARSRDGKWKKLVELSGSEDKAIKNYNEYTGRGGALKRWLGR